MKVVNVNEDGWSDWQYPIMKGYKAGCCDCGLVHDVEFKVIKITKRNKDGTFDYKELNNKDLKVMLRAKRNNRSTGQVRRHMDEKQDNY